MIAANKKPISVSSDSLSKYNESMELIIPPTDTGKSKKGVSNGNGHKSQSTVPQNRNANHAVVKTSMTGLTASNSKGAPV